MNKLPRISVIGVGVVGGLAAVLGLLYNFTSLTAVLNGGPSDLVEQHGLTYFYPAFYVMSCICIACYILLLLCVADLLRVRFRRLWLFTGVLVFEVVYFFSVGMSWLIPSVGMSIGAATGVANGGLTVQFLILFPLWAPIVVWWARMKLEHEKPAD
jgi:glucan phosphoethanolaminetransferase (alkaline phosphatase superfamily)